LLDLTTQRIKIILSQCFGGDNDDRYGLPRIDAAHFGDEFENLLHLVMMLGPDTDRSPEEVENQVAAWLENLG